MKRTVLAIALSSALLAACGGGGGSPSEPDSNTTNTPTVSRNAEPRDCSWSNLGATVMPPDQIAIFAGQSNMRGFGYRPALAAVPALPAVAVWTGTEWRAYDVPKCFGPELEFVMRWQADHPGQTLGIIKVAYGDTAMVDWRPDWVESEARYPELGSLFAMTVDAWRTSGALPIVAYVWAQGETDANLVDAAPYYQARTQSMIDAFRVQVGYAPFVYVQTQWPAAHAIATVSAAQEALASTATRVCMARTGDVPTYSDQGWNDVHYTTEGQRLVGDRLYDAFQICR